jgi:serine protease Do
MNSNNVLRLGITLIVTSLVGFSVVSSFGLDTEGVEKVETNMHTLPPPPQPITSVEKQTRIAVFKKANPAVVAIDVGKVYRSGFIVTPDGLVLTDARILEKASSTVTVLLNDPTTLNGRKELQADIIARASDDSRLAVIKIRNQKNLPTLKIAKSNSLKTGQTVYSIPLPVDLIVLNSLLTSEDSQPQAPPLNGDEQAIAGIVNGIRDRGNLIQHDAEIDMGIAGGPLLNATAEVIGVNTFGWNAPLTTKDGKTIAFNEGTIGVNFALSAQLANTFLVAREKNDVDATASASQTQPESTRQREEVPNLPTNGKAISAKLKDGDPTLPNNSYYHMYAIDGKAGQKLVIEVDSKQIDPSVILLLPDRQKIVEQNDDIAPDNFNAKLEVTLPEDNVYLILTSAFEAGEDGDYNIKAYIR